MSNHGKDIIDDADYNVDDSHTVKGIKLKKFILFNQDPHIIEILGAISIALTIGWLLGYTIHSVKKESVDITFFSSIVTTLMGATVVGFFSKSSKLLGVYGLCVGLGFLIYCLIQ